MIITKTPYRISFFGGGTDYPHWYNKFGGKVISTTIDKYAYITIRKLPPFFKHDVRVSYSKIEARKGVDKIKHKAVREILKHKKISKNIEILHIGDLPARSGIGSSSSFTVGLLNGINEMQNIKSTKQKLALEAIHLEQNVIKEFVGSQDQIAAACGGFNYIIFNKKKSFEIKKNFFDEKILKKLNENLFLYFTGISRTAEEIVKTYKFLNHKNDKKTYLIEINKQVDEAAKKLKEGKIDDFGRLLHETWILKKKLSNKITNQKINSIYKRGIESGALGGKLLGAGGGGHIIFYVPKNNQKKFKLKMKKLLHIPFSFEKEGSSVVFKK